MAGAGSASVNGNGKLEEPDHSSSNWYFSREDIEKRSPSRLDGIDLKRETYFRKSYCTFLQDLGMCLKVPQVTIATAIVFSHRFFLRQSHFKNDRHIIATICMFLAGKVEETPRPLRDVILLSYEIRHKKDPAALARIKQKETYEEQKELVLIGERLVLTTLGFDLNIAHPYKPLVAAIKKLKVAQNALAQVAWNFVNDGLRTSLCLQFKPHHIAAGAIFLAAKFLKVKLPQDGEKVWWQEFEVTPRQLEEVSNQMLELYEQNKTFCGTALANGSRASDPGSGTLSVNRVKGSDYVPSANGHYIWSHTAASSADSVEKTDKVAQAAVKTDDVTTSSRGDEVPEFTASNAASFTQVKLENGRLGTEYEPVYENGYEPGAPELSLESKRTVKSVSNAQVKQVVKEEVKEQIEDSQTKEQARADFRVKSESGTILRKAKIKAEMEERKVTNVDGVQDREIEDMVDSKPDLEVDIESVKVKVENEDEEPKKLRVTSMEGVNLDRVNILKEEKRRKSKGEGLELKATALKMELNDEEELLQRDRESGVEAGTEAERVKQERRDSKSKAARKTEDGITGGKKEATEGVEAGSKRRRNNEEDGVIERKWSKSSERGDRAEGPDGEGDRSRAGPSDRAEDGELPTASHTNDHTRSPRQSDRRPGAHEKGSSPSSLKRHRDQHGRRDAHRDNRAGHGPRERDYHQRDNHHRADGDRDRHHYKDRDYQERDHKKGRVHDVHGN